MRQTLSLVIFIAVATLTTGCSGRSDIEDTAAGKHSHADFDQTKSLADSLYSCMQFRDAYKLFLLLLDSKEAETDNEKRLSVLNALCNASELSGHKAEEPKWLHLLLDLAMQRHETHDTKKTAQS